jgi:LPXTG-motif cell wall-anchored protein
VVVSDLSFPTSIDFNPAGDAYVTTNGVGAPGSGEVLLFAGLAKQMEAAAAPPSLPATGSERSAGVWIALGTLALGVGLAAAGLVLRRRSLV